MPNYRLSKAAESDLEDMYAWGLEHHGEAQADAYFRAMFDGFQEIAKNPEAWQAVDHVRPGYRRAVIKAHSVYFRVRDGMTEIMAILRHQDTTGRI